MEKTRYLFAPPFSENVETFLLPIPKFKSETSDGFKIAGGWRYFDKLRVIQKKKDAYLEVLMSPKDLLHLSKVNCKGSLIKAEMNLERIIKNRPAYSNCDMSQPHLMGVINLTPDSFYKSSRKQDYNSIEKTLKKMKNFGASIIDIGGESSKPGAQRISVCEEKKRVIPVIEKLKGINSKALISLDTRNLSTMKKGYEKRVDIINDITGFNNKKKISYVSKNKIPIIVMHMQQDPSTMQDNPKYSFAPIDIYKFFLKKIDQLTRLGVDSANIIIDPGIGFGKNKFHNLDILRNLTIFHSLGVPILLGLSRKSLIEELTVDNYRSWGINKKSVSPSKRLSGSIAFAMHAINCGVQIIRTHDVFETNQAIICQRALI